MRILTLIILLSFGLQSYAGNKPSEKAAQKKARIEKWKYDQVSRLAGIVRVPYVEKPAPFEVGEPIPVDDTPESVRLAKATAESCSNDIDRFRTIRPKNYYWAYKTTAQDGPWNVGSTWTGGVVPATTDSVQILNGHTVTLPNAYTANIAGIFIAGGGELIHDATGTSTINCSRNFEVQGLYRARPSDITKTHTLKFVGVNEAAFVGGGMDVLVNDIGLWVMVGGQLDLVGTTKKSWTNATATVSIGATSMTVNDATGWVIGDEIVIAPTSKPDMSGLDFNDGTGLPIDPFMSQFERRTITGVSGNTISWSGGLTYAHNAVSSSITSTTYGTSTRNWTAEVANLTRNVKVQGESATSRAHVFIRNTVQTAQNMQYVQFKWLGPRKINAAVHGSRKTLISGRYGIHFHFGNYFSANSQIIGCAMSDIGNRGYVPHETHDITMNDNVAFDYMETAFWWDEGELSHFIVWDHNLLMGARYNGTGVPAKHTSMQINQGDGNEATNNVIVYGSNTNLHGNGAYTWEANSEGVWIFEGNMAHSSMTGLWVWQNTSLNHTIINYDSYNNTEGITHGAYSNSYQYTGGHHYRSLIFIEATSANTNGVVFKDIFFDAGGEDYGTFILDSPVPPATTQHTSKYVQCVFRGHAIQPISVFGQSNQFNTYKIVDIINCDLDGDLGYDFHPAASLASSGLDDLKQNGFIARVQALSGANYQTERVAQADVFTSGIADFAPRLYGDGINGLQADYFDEPLLAGTPAFTRYESIIMFDVWNADEAINPNGVHHLVTQGFQYGNDETYSVRWTGKVEAHYTANTQFRFYASGKYRMYFDDGGGEDLIIDQWATSSPDPGTLTSSAIPLVAGTKYNIRIEMSNLSTGAQGAVFSWKTPQMTDFQIVPQSQLFEPSSNSAPTAVAGSDQTITLPDNDAVLSAAGSGDLEGAITYAWTQTSGPNTASFSSTTVQSPTVSGLIAGSYVFRVTVTDDDLATDFDEVTVTVNPANSLPTVDAGPNQSITLPTSTVNLNSNGGVDSDGTIADITWTKTSGPSTYTIDNDDIADPVLTNLVEGVYIFTCTVTDDDGGTGFDQVQITVNPAVANQAPTTNAGADQRIRYPLTTVVLQATASDPDGFITSQTWTKVSGPNTPNIQNPASLETTISGLTYGTYVFRITVRDDGADDTYLVATDEVTVIVNKKFVTSRKDRIFQ
jgi:hypothetical protein